MTGAETLSHCTDYKQIKKPPAVVQTADDEKVLEFDPPSTFILPEMREMSMSEYKYVRVTESYNGKRYEGYGKTEKEAMKKLAAKLEKAKRGEDTIGENMTVDAWFKTWKKTYKESKGLTEKSMAMYDQKYNNHISPSIGHLRMKEVKTVHLQQILNRQAGMSESHVKKTCMVIKAIFKRARQNRIIIYDPAESLELPKFTVNKRRSVTEEERALILKTAETHRAGLWVLTMLYTGMRPGETAALTWDNVNLKEKEIYVVAAKESGNKNIKTTKTQAGVRTIPIRKELLPLLTAAKKKTKRKLVFVNTRGAALDDDAMHRMWKNFVRQMNINAGAEIYRNKIIKPLVANDLTTYCLRHTFATDLQRAGVPINVAKEIMGHEDIAVTANIYTHKDTDLLHKYFDEMDEGVGNYVGNVD